MPTIRPSAQAYSDAIMKVRELALELKDAVIDAATARVVLQTEMMADPGSKMMAMESGDIEVLECELLAAYGKARMMHKAANDIGRKHNEPMPSNPVYDPEYSYLYTKTAGMRLSAPARR